MGCNTLVALDRYRACQLAECGDAGDASITPASVPQLLIGGLGNLPGIVSDNTNVYFVDNDAIRYCALGGCGGIGTMLLRAPGRDITSQLTLDGTSLLYGDSVFGASGSIRVAASRPDSGGNSQPIATTPNTPQALILCGDRVCWIDRPSAGQARVLSCPRVACTLPTPLMQVDPLTWVSAGALTSDGTKVYAISNNAIISCPITGCGGPPTVVNYSLNVHGLAFYDGKLYWVTNGGQTNGSLARCDPATCTFPEIMATNLPTPWNVAVDASGIYWTSAGNPGQVLKCDQGNCKPYTVLASGQPQPTLITIDDTHVLWVNTGSGNVQIMSVAK